MNRAKRRKATPKPSARKTADGKRVRSGMLLWTEDGTHVEKVKSIDGDVVRSAYAATRWPKGMPVERLYSQPVSQENNQ